MHVFDEAIALAATGEDTYTGATHPAWNNMVGPFGGITAATVLNGVLRHPKLLGTPVSLTVNYAAAVASGAFTLQAVPVRTNRSTQHWTLAIAQPGPDGTQQTVLTATAVTAARRETWSINELQMPAAEVPETLPRARIAQVEWANRYDFRVLEGAVPKEWDGGGTGSLTRQWVRDDTGRAVDYAALAAMADVFFPRVWLRRANPVPAGTVSITVYFHADTAMLARTGSGYLLAQAQAQTLRNGFFDQSAQLWNAAGDLLVTSHQIVYYKE